MRPRLEGRTVLFYIGGRTADSLTLRFHVERDDGREWLDLADGAFLRKERIRVYRATAHSLVEIVPR
jgi:hypothetical protein